MIRNWLLASAAAFALTAVAPAGAQYADSAAISGLNIRNIGSAQMSGRIAAVAARQEKNGKVTVFVGSASGGVWKSEDGGTNFKPVFDKQPVQSIGAVALDPSNPAVLWVGTGETWTRNSVSVGNGIYKSVDGGETWTHAGLAGTERINKIVVHPTNSNIVYACAPGALWSDSADRGMYKTTDGGRTWSLILKGANLSTGCSAVTLDPSNPNHLITGTWDFRRKPDTFRSGGDGPNAASGSRMMESRDGGRTWTELNTETRKGLPKQPWGRVEVEFAPSNPKRLYSFIENPRSALFVSEDGGKTWTERDRSQGMVWRPFYFSNIVVDPKDENRLFKMGYSVIVSDDGGKSFANTAGSSHADWHDVWINPTNTKHLIGADDGGLWTSYDGGSRWWKSNNLPISQFYHVSADTRDPYQVYGGLQDNSSWVGDQEYPGGITNQRWENLYGGDGFYAFSDPADDNYVYVEYQGGNIARVNRKTLEARNIQPLAGYKEKLRYNWNTPIALSPNEKGTIYIGSQFLFRSRDHGVNWDRISPDLTTNDPNRQRQEQSGGITVDNSSAEMNTTIYSIAESPIAPGMIWVGTDDGNIQMTRDGGRNWQNLTAKVGMPQGNWISTVEPSRFSAGTAYATNDRHMYGDMNPYLYRTTDYGRTWQRLVGPGTAGVRGYAHVIREDRENPNVLYLGTEHGLFVSVNSGGSWAQFKPGNFPDGIAVRDVALAPGNDIVLATHGRGIWIIDDVTPLRQMSSDILNAPVAMFGSQPVQQRIQGNGGWSDGDASYAGENPPAGAVITYYQKARHVIGRMKLEILDSAGNVVDELPASKRRGLNRVVWSMRTKPPQVPPAATFAFNSAFGQRVMPGQYTARLTKNGQVVSTPVTVTLDRRAKFDLDDRRAQYEAAERVKGMFGRMSALVGQLNGVRAQVASIAGNAAAAADVKAAAAQLSTKADALRKEIVATTEGGAITGEERLREHTDTLFGAINSVEERPTNYQMARLEALDRELKDVEAQWAALTTSDLAALNARLQAGGLKPVKVAAISFDPDAHPAGGRAEALVRALVGTRFYGNAAALERKSEKD